MSDDERPTTGTAAVPGPVPHYEIRVKGRLAPRWSAWFDGLFVEPAPDDTTAIRGPIPDQAALHGVLTKVRDLGLSLESLTRLPSDGSAIATESEHTDTTDHPTPGAPS